MFRFEKLSVWKKSLEFADAVYSATEPFPPRERFGLTSQLRRAAGSVGANIAENSSRVSNKDFSRFIEIAFGSLCETIAHLFLAKKRQMIGDPGFGELYSKADELSRILSSFRSSLGKWKPEASEGE